MQSTSIHLDAAFRNAIHLAFGVDVDPLISLAQNEKFGDYQSNVAMSLAKQVEIKNPRSVAEQILGKLDLGDTATTSIAGPGFINIKLSLHWLDERLAAMARDDRLGIDLVSKPQTVVVDYSAPNVAKQMHVGNMRSTIIGDAICRLLAFRGDVVIRQNHIGDWGTQFGMLIAYLRETNQEDAAAIADLDQFYKAARKRFDADPKFADESRATVVRLQAGGADEMRLWQQIVDESRKYFETSYRQIGALLLPSDERGESFYNTMLADTVEQLKHKRLARLSEGAVAVFTEGATSPLIIEKTGGGYGYATTDLAAIRFRVGELHANRIIYLVGSPQSQHFKQVFATAIAAGWAEGVSLEHASFGSILGDDGKMFKTRSGESVRLADLLDEAEARALVTVTAKNPELAEAQRKSIARAVGIGAVKYADLSKDRVGDYVFSFDQMLAMDGNTAPYLQYAYARIRSIFRRAEGPIDLNVKMSLQSPYEQTLAKMLLRFGDILTLVARELKPHYLCTYLYELATTFSAFYENCPVLKSQADVRGSRLALCELTAKTMAQGLESLGIEHPEVM